MLPFNFDNLLLDPHVYALNLVDLSYQGARDQQSHKKLGRILVDRTLAHRLLLYGTRVRRYVLNICYSVESVHRHFQFISCLEIMFFFSILLFLLIMSHNSYAMGQVRHSKCVVECARGAHFFYLSSFQYSVTMGVI